MLKAVHMGLGSLLETSECSSVSLHYDSLFMLELIYHSIYSILV